MIQTTILPYYAEKKTPRNIIWSKEQLTDFSKFVEENQQNIFYEFQNTDIFSWPMMKINIGKLVSCKFSDYHNTCEIKIDANTDLCKLEKISNLTFLCHGERDYKTSRVINPEVKRLAYVANFHISTDTFPKRKPFIFSQFAHSV